MPVLQLKQESMNLQQAVDLSKKAAGSPLGLKLQTKFLGTVLPTVTTSLAQVAANTVPVDGKNGGQHGS